MKNLKFLNSLVLQILFLLGLTVFARTTEPIDIWKENDEPQTDQKIIKENVLEDNNNLILKKLEKKEIIVSEEENNIKIQNVYGLFDPEDNDLDLTPLLVQTQSPSFSDTICMCFIIFIWFITRKFTTTKSYRCFNEYHFKYI